MNSTLSGMLPLMTMLYMGDADDDDGVVVLSLASVSLTRRPAKASSTPLEEWSPTRERTVYAHRNTCTMLCMHSKATWHFL